LNISETVSVLVAVGEIVGVEVTVGVGVTVRVGVEVRMGLGVGLDCASDTEGVVTDALAVGVGAKAYAALKDREIVRI
jgi:hypothetical protein